jgi:hypothetical protein
METASYRMVRPPRIELGLRVPESLALYAKSLINFKSPSAKLCRMWWISAAFGHVLVTRHKRGAGFEPARAQTEGRAVSGLSTMINLFFPLSFNEERQPRFIINYGG